MTHQDSSTPIVLCACGCNQPTPIAKRTRHTLGHIKGHHVPFVPGHNGTKHPTRRCQTCTRLLDRDAFDPRHRANGALSGLSLRCRECTISFRNRNHPRRVVDRFWSRVDTSGGPDACWPWTRGQLAGGYGSFRFSDRNHGAHRVSWTLTHGGIPEGMCVCHHCDNPPCCNPRHLFLDSNEGNIADRVAKSRTRTGASCGSAHGMSRLTEAAVLEIRSRDRHIATVKELAVKHGVSETCIRDAHRGKTWKHVRPAVHQNAPEISASRAEAIAAK